jgi:tetrahydromethanopterin S-methyltransferase subunit B
MNAHDEYATDTTRAAIKAALAGLDCAYKAVTDARIEDQIVAAIDELNERLGHIDNIAEQIESERKPWFSAYAAA